MNGTLLKHQWFTQRKSVRCGLYYAGVKLTVINRVDICISRQKNLGASFDSSAAYAVENTFREIEMRFTSLHLLCVFTF